MSDLRELYQEVILDHGKTPRNFGKIPEASCQSSGHNPFCGDNVTVYLQLEDNTVSNVLFEGRGCAISIASASLMTEILLGKKLDYIERLFAYFHDLVTEMDPKTNVMPDDEDLEKLSVLAGVREFPMRVKCATLAWHTMQAALSGKSEDISTE